MPVGTFSMGNSSRTTPKHSGNTPPPRPCSPRPRIISSSESERADERPDGEQAEGDGQQALLAEHVAEAAEDRCGDRGDEQVGGDQPGDVAGRGAEVALHLAQCRDHGGLREDEAEQADAENEEGPAGCLPRAAGFHGVLLLMKTKYVLRFVSGP
jgi:hypothetical protein